MINSDGTGVQDIRKSLIHQAAPNRHNALTLVFLSMVTFKIVAINVLSLVVLRMVTFINVAIHVSQQ